MAVFAYPYETEPDGGGWLVRFPDLPEAVTSVSAQGELAAATADCLRATLGGYAAENRVPPIPSPARGRPTVALDALASAKLTLLREMAEQGISNVMLAERLGVSEKVVRRLRDPDHRSHIGAVERALAVLGVELVLATRRMRIASG